MQSCDWPYPNYYCSICYHILNVRANFAAIACYPSADLKLYSHKAFFGGIECHLSRLVSCRKRCVDANIQGITELEVPCTIFGCLMQTMAANYWASTQRRHWQFTKDTLVDIRQKLEGEDRGLVQQYTLPDRRLQSIFFNQRM